MASDRSGDADLDALLAAAGSAYDAAGVRRLLPGVLAAPEACDPNAWMALLGGDPSPELRDRLQALKGEAARAGGEAAAGDPAARLAALRGAVAAAGLAGFVVPRADEHQGEYVARRAERLAWLTGFTGSAGLAVVLAEAAAVFVDGRYTLQAAGQVDGGLYEVRQLPDESAEAWIAGRLPAGAGLGYDPWLHTEDQVVRLRAAAEKAGGCLEACGENPLDRVWSDRPPPPLAPVRAHGLKFAGKASAEKRQELAADLREAGAAAAVLTLPDSIAWLLNVRGGDVPHTPLALSFALLYADGRVDWFIDPRKLVPSLAADLDAAVAVRPPEGLGPALDALGRDGRAVAADPARAAAWVFDRLRAAGAKVVKAEDPCLLPKARKNEAELAGARRAHLRDGAALTRFLKWLSEATAGDGNAGVSNAGVSEIEAAARLTEFRAASGALRDLSFDTISGAGPNGAIVHYRATEASNRRLGPGELYLVDSGGQYDDGTTDITRTLAIGAPTAEMRDRFTRVLQGHIALARARFPRGTTGGQLDSLARLALWRAGLDFDHGTGHGVGSYLAVHEGPQRISKRGGGAALAPGMIVSNEPGYYKTGAYGIRIENLVAVVESEKAPGAERDMLAFETLSLAPIDLTLVEPALLSPEERAWLDAYHARVRRELSPLLDAETAGWLAEAARALEA